LDKRLSEQIKSFLDFLDECQELNSMAYNGVGDEDKRHQDLIHAIEFEHNPDKITKIGMKLHQNRVERRVYKDLFEVTNPVVEFVRDPQNKKTIDQMRQLLGKVRKAEKRHENRVYIPRLKEDSGHGQEDSV